MLCFPAHRMTEEEAACVAGWRYTPPYDVYNESDPSVFLSGRYACILDGEGVPAAFYTYGEDARVIAAQPIYDAEPDLIDMGLGLRPDLTGQGWGLLLAERAMEALATRQNGRGFRLAVHAWNARAIRLYRRLGFEGYAQCGEGAQVFGLMRRDDTPWREATRMMKPGMPLFPGDPPFEQKLFLSLDPSGYDASLLSFSAHTGTHIDAPMHVGLPGDTELWPLDDLNRAAQLLDLTGGRTPTVATEELALARCPRLLLKTRGPNYPQGRPLSLEAAKTLCALGVRMVGVDGFSVGTISAEGLSVHKTLLGGNVLVLENAALEAFAAGYYHMRCLPIRLSGLDGAPVRLWLRKA